MADELIGLSDLGLDLPPRQAQILLRIIKGDSEKQIAARLALSPHTVHAHVKLLHRKFNVSSRGELVWAYIDRLHAFMRQQIASSQESGGG